jgi:hypothetical protein
MGTIDGAGNVDKAGLTSILRAADSEIVGAAQQMVGNAPREEWKKEGNSSTVKGYEDNANIIAAFSRKSAD